MTNLRRYLWLGCLLTCMTARLPAEARDAEAKDAHTVISTSLENLKYIDTLGESSDVLGADYHSGEAQLRLSKTALAKLSTEGVPFTSLEAESFVTRRSIEQYKKPADVVDYLRAVAAQYPHLVELREIGRSTDQRPIMGVVLTAKNDLEAKPSILFNAMHHAREVMSAEVALDIITELTRHYGQDNEITAWLDHYQVIVVPQVNPDGNKRVHDGDVWWRKNTFQRSGEVLGVDLNRNYPTLWNGCNGSSGSASSEIYRGPTAASEPETKALMALVAATKPIFNISYHSYSEIIIYPFGCSRVPNSAASLFREVAEEMAEAITDDRGEKGTYRSGTAPELLYQADGSDLDFQWAEHNVMAYTIEINSQRLGFQPDYDSWRDKTVANQRGGWKTLMRRLGAGGVRADIADAQEGITYGIERRDATGAYSMWDTAAGGEKKALRPHGLLYQPLEAGSYRLLFFKDQQLLQAIPVQVEGTLRDLGKLSLR